MVRSPRGPGAHRPTPCHRGLAATVAACAVALTAACAAPPPPPRLIEVTVPADATLDAVATALVERGLVRSASAFRRYVRMAGADTVFPAGVYYLPRQPMGTLVAALHRGPTMGRVTVPEGAMLSEVAATVAGALPMTTTAFVAAARDTALRRRLGYPRTLEGRLYPTTYYVSLDISPSDLVAHMVAEFARRWDPSWSSRARRYDWTPDDLVTFASIVSGETRDSEEQPVVAAVYHNRLRRGMRLQADPTVVYALGTRRRLTHDDYRVASPYNTYRADGLPPAPVGQVSVASIEAALTPARHDYLFFVAGADGRHVFSRTYREHLAAIQRVRRGVG